MCHCSPFKQSSHLLRYHRLHSLYVHVWSAANIPCAQMVKWLQAGNSPDKTCVVIMLWVAVFFFAECAFFITQTYCLERVPIFHMVSMLSQLTFYSVKHVPYIPLFHCFIFMFCGCPWYFGIKEQWEWNLIPEFTNTVNSPLLLSISPSHFISGPGTGVLILMQIIHDLLDWYQLPIGLLFHKYDTK